MTLQNRVMPTGDIVADPARGTLMGNRGILHDDTRTLGPARWRHRNWITCVLAFKDRKRPLMAPGRYTELFFLDEAVACAAGHRPCAECRRADFRLFRDAWVRGTGLPGDATGIDAALHRARVTRDRRQVRHTRRMGDVPDGAFVMWQDAAHLRRGDGLFPFHPGGYGEPVAVPVPDLAVTVLTPAPMADAMRAGFRPALHPTAAA